jgi:hypothetical protein
MKNRKALPITGGAFFVENRLTPSTLRAAPPSPASPERGDKKQICFILFPPSAEQLRAKPGRTMVGCAVAGA